MASQTVNENQGSTLADYYPGTDSTPTDKKTLYCARAFFSAFLLGTGVAAGYSFRAVLDPHANSQLQIPHAILGTLLVGVTLLSGYGLRLSFLKNST